MKSRKNKDPKHIILKILPAIAVFVFMLYLSHHHQLINYRAFLIDLLGQPYRGANTFGPSLFVNINRDLSAIGGPTEMILITSLVSVYLFFVNEKKILFKFVSYVLVTGIYLFTLKYVFNHNRPDSLLDFIFADNLAFPSGHALVSLVIFSMLADYLNRKISDNKARFVVNASAAILILMVGISRIIIGSHDPWQVLAGWSAGFALITVINYFGGIHPAGKSVR